MSLPNHGANPLQTIEALGLSIEKELLDFSVNTNPLGSPAEIKQYWATYFQNVESYPDPHVNELRMAISKKEQLSAEQILVGNGAAELIFMIASHFRNKKVLIIEPGFSEYRDACKAFGCEVESFVLSEKNGWQVEIEELTKRMKGKDLLFICHPNNPTGVIYSQAIWIPLLTTAEQLGVTVVVDEAFYDFCVEQISVAHLVTQFSNVIVLRSLTKMYAIAGIRLGYLLTNEKVVKQLKGIQPPWSVNGLAQKLGLVCIQATDHVRQTRTLIANERNRLFSQLQQLGFDFSPSKTNFYLVKERNETGNTKQLMTFLIKNGIIPRHTYNFQGLNGQFLRLAIKLEGENEQLLQVLKDWKDR